MITQKIDNAIKDAFSSFYDPLEVEILRTLINKDNIIAVAYTYKSSKIRILVIDLEKDYSICSCKYETWFHLSSLASPPLRKDSMYYWIYEKITESGLQNLI